MDRRERFESLAEAILAILPGWQGTIRTAGPGIVQSFNAIEGTVVVQHAIMARVTNPDQTQEDVEIPLLTDVPVQFPGGGGFILTFPLQEGDEVLVVISDRCIDDWWQSGEIGLQSELRMHDLSDGFVIPRISSKPNVVTNISTTAAQLRQDDGTAYLELSGGGLIKLVAPGGLIIDGDVSVTGTIVATGDVEGAGISLSTHRHPGVTAGGATTGGPI